MLIQNAVILDENFQLARKDILVEGDRIVATGTGFSTEGQEVVDASGLTAVLRRRPFFACTRSVKNFVRAQRELRISVASVRGAVLASAPRLR